MKQIYIHGLGQTPECWNKVILQMNAAPQSICPDLAELVRGKETTYQNLYSSFSELCNRINEPLILYGLSLGGVLALNYAIDHPEKVQKLILIATQYKMPKKLLRFQNFIFRLMPSSAFQQTGFGKKDFLHLCHTMTDLDFSETVQKISCPSLILYGEKDRPNKAASIELASLLQCATLRELHGAGHEVNTDVPDQLAEITYTFIHE